jgi:hypothetical protein
MQIFNSGFFWFVEGILVVIMVLGLRAWAEDRGIPMPPWKWVLFFLWILVVGFTVAFVGTSFGEGEPTAATRGGLLFGLISIISGVAVWRLLVRGADSDVGSAAPESW